MNIKQRNNNYIILKVELNYIGMSEWTTSKITMSFFFSVYKKYWIFVYRKIQSKSWLDLKKKINNLVH